MFDTVDRYSFVESKWRRVAKMSMSRDGLGVATYDGRIYVAGGISCLIMKLIGRV